MGSSPVVLERALCNESAESLK